MPTFSSWRTPGWICTNHAYAVIALEITIPGVVPGGIMVYASWVKVRMKVNQYNITTAYYLFRFFEVELMCQINLSSAVLYRTCACHPFTFRYCGSLRNLANGWYY